VGGVLAVLDATGTERASLVTLSRSTWHGAGTRMDYATTDPEALAHAIADGLKRPVIYRNVETDGARRAAAVITRLI
jgi:hypothetical protein